MPNFLSVQDLNAMGFRRVGRDVCISCKASIHRPESITLADHVRIDDFCLLSGGSGITLGRYVHIAAHSAVYGGGGVVFEDYTGLSPRCTVLSESDDFSGDSMVQPFFPKAYKPGYVSEPVVLRRFSQVGTNSTLLPGVELGTGAAVGAHALVTESCDPWGIYAGIPARRIGDRSRNMLALEKQYRASLLETCSEAACGHDGSCRERFER